MKKRRGCVKYGCFGCAGVAGVFLIVSLAIGIGALVSDDTENREQRELVQAIPSIDLPADDPSQATTDILPRPLFRSGGFGAAPDAGIVDIRLTAGTFLVVPGPAGDPIRVEADFDTNRYKLEQTYEAAGDGKGWVYKVRFGPKNFFKLFGIHDGSSRVRLILPRDAPFALRGIISMAESEVELGGLWVTSVNLETGMGDHAISFDQPVMTPMEEFEVDGSMGVLRIDRLGNASPKNAFVKLSMGELQLDLDGPWARDADVKIRSSMGECGVRLPDGVNIDLQRAAIGIGERNIRGTREREEIPGAPTLHLDASHSMGELRIR